MRAWPTSSGRKIGPPSSDERAYDVSALRGGFIQPVVLKLVAREEIA
jgi:hypothetical protein